MYKINIVGAGFVGLTLAEVLSNQSKVEKVTIFDVDKDKINKLTNGEIYVSEKGLTLKSNKLSYVDDITKCDGDIYFVCVGTPTINGKQELRYLIESVKSISEFNSRATIIIKSSVLPNNIDKIIDITNTITNKVITNPEFLAEGTAVADMKNQKILVVGVNDSDKKYATKLFTEVFGGTYKTMKLVGIYEAMMIKYFLNSYKAMKLTFINEIAHYCQSSEIKFSEIIDAVKLDPVMGKGFDLPGIGYGGSCFPKDTEAFRGISSIAGYINDLNSHTIESITKIICDGCENYTILIGGKAFKNGTNDLRYSIGSYIGNELSKNNKVYYYDSLPELSDFTINEIRENKDKFDMVIIVNDLPELAKIFEGSNILFNTRKFD